MEEEANSYFVRMYKGEIRIPQLIDLLLRYKSGSRREQDVCACIITSLFDEYKFFSRYPEKELVLTSILFGGLIQHRIVQEMALGNALRYVLEACRLDPSSLLFSFGIQALRQFQTRLSEWPQYCALLLQIPHLEAACPDILGYIKTAEPTDETFSSIKCDVVADADDFYPPVEATQDRIMFIVNNLSDTNLDAKITEMKALFQKEYTPWLSAYLVSKRITIEPNYHSLYLQFLHALPHQDVLARFLLHETYSAIRVLLQSPKTVTSSEERTLLKNLGMWLGSITLGL